jgi:hypothetical protein
MALCTDPRLTYLNSLGYNVLKLPREKLSVMTIIGRHNGVMQELGLLSNIWKTEVKPPEQEEQEVGSEINGQETNDLKLSIGLEILSGILKVMGAVTPEVDFAYQNAKSLQFGFKNVTMKHVQPFLVGEYLSKGDLNEKNPFGSYFTDEDKEAFVVTDVLVSNAIKVTAKNRDGLAVGVDVPAISKAVSAKIKVKFDQKEETVVTYEGATSLAFGFKVFGIQYANGNWGIYGAKPSAEIAFDAETEPEAVLLSTSGRIHLQS